MNAQYVYYVVGDIDMNSVLRAAFDKYKVEQLSEWLSNDQFAVSIRPDDAIDIESFCGEPGDSLGSPADSDAAPNPVSASASSYAEQLGQPSGSPSPTGSNAVRKDHESAQREPSNFQHISEAKVRRLTDMAIITEFVVGTPVEIIAKNYRLDFKYINRLREEWLKACRLQESFDYRHDLKVLALDAIRDGLKSDKDPYKRMGGGIRVMAGIGEFKQDTINVNVLQRIENVPPELRGRFLTSTAAEEDAAIEVEVIDKKGE